MTTTTTPKTLTYKGYTIYLHRNQYTGRVRGATVINGFNNPFFPSLAAAKRYIDA